MIAKNTLEKIAAKFGLPKYRVGQILRAVYKQGKNSYEQMSVLPKEAREVLQMEAPIFSLRIKNQSCSKSDGAIKTLFELKDGQMIEGVLMRFKDGRNSVCVSSQAGCGLKCVFCATGRMGFKRHLTDEEISDQVLYFDQLLKKEQSRVSHVVFMGMGEPLLNYENVMNAVRTLNDADCLGIAARRITISSSGIVTGIKKLANEPLQVNLAISLHAPNQELRRKLMPVAAAYSLDELMKSINEYIQKTGRRVSYEYVMLAKINDLEEQALELAELIKGQMCHVNLIPYNETSLGFAKSDKKRIEIFKEILMSFNITTTVRVSLGKDISAACGQLRAAQTKV